MRNAERPTRNAPNCVQEGLSKSHREESIANTVPSDPQRNAIFLQRSLVCEERTDWQRNSSLIVRAIYRINGFVILHMADESIHPPPGGAPSSSATASEGPVPRSQKSATEPKKDMPSSSPSFSDPARTGSRESRERKKKVAPPPKGSAQKGKVEDGTVHNSSSVENEKTQQTRSPKPNPKKNSHNRGRKGAPVDETKEVKETTVDTESQSPNSRKPRSQKRSASPSQNKKKPQRKEKKHKLVLVKFSPKMMYSGLPLVQEFFSS